MDSQAAKSNNEASFALARHSAVVDTLLRMLDGLRYGSIEITVHDAIVVQIERRDKIRI